MPSASATKNFSSQSVISFLYFVSLLFAAGLMSASSFIAHNSLIRPRKKENPSTPPTSSSSSTSPITTVRVMSSDLNFPSEPINPEMANLSSHQPFQSIFNHLRQITNMAEVLHSPQSNPQIGGAIYYMNQVQLEHLGIDGDYVAGLTNGQCMNVLESRQFDIAAFLLPAGFKLHLHDHPNMVVCSKLLYGAASIRSFSKIKRLKSGDIEAKLEVDMEKTSSDEPWILTPKHGNYHEITPLTECVMLDILLPPYDDEQRPCHFYDPVQASSEESNDENIYLLKRLSSEEQLQIPLPYTVTYNGHRPG